MSCTLSMRSTQIGSSERVPVISLPFTCNTCKVAFESNQLQRAHMHTEYHRYNLKRKIAALPSLSLEVYHGSVLSPIKATPKQSPVDVPELSSGLSEASLKEETEDPTVEQDFGPLKCLFCRYESPTLRENLQHMEKGHGMFIPYQESLEDAEGLLSYLFTIITKFQECLYCGKVKDNVSGIRSHMIDKGHCMIAFDEELEQFYDAFGEDVEGQLEGDNSIAKDRAIHEASETGHDFHPDSDHELHLPSGRTLGHRSLFRYYRQNLHSYPTPAERAARRAITASTVDEASPLQAPTGRQLATRPRGEMGMIGVGEFEKRALKVVEKKALKQEARVRNQFEAKVNKEANYQKHFKPDVPGRSNG